MGKTTPIQLSIPNLPIDNRCWLLCVVLALVLFVTSAPSYGQENTSPYYCLLPKRYISQQLNDSIAAMRVITGVVIDEIKEPIIGGIVLIKEGKKIVGYAITDTAGKFKLDLNTIADTHGPLTLETSYWDYKKNAIPLVQLSDFIVSQLELDPNRSKYMTEQPCHYIPILFDPFYNSTRISGEDLKHMGGN